MKKLFVALMAILFAAIPSVGQQYEKGFEIHQAASATVWGPIVEEFSHHLRMGNMGMSSGISFGATYFFGRCGIGLDIASDQTQIWRWKKVEEIDRVGWRPQSYEGDHIRKTEIGVVTLAVPFSCRATSWLTVTAGVGLHILDVDYSMFGAGPLYQETGLLAVSARAPWIVAPYIRYALMPGYVTKESLTGFKDQASLTQRPFPKPPAWFVPQRLDIGISAFIPVSLF